MNDPLSSLARDARVEDAVDEVRAAVDRLLGHRVLRNRSAEVSSESALRGARASAALDGSDVPLHDMRSGAQTSALARGAVRVSGELGALVETWRRAPRQVLARLHTLAAAEIVSSDALGRPRPDQQVADPLSLGAPPTPTEVSVRVDTLADLLVGGTDAPAVVVAAVTHGELLALRPFGTADGIVARAAQRLTLISRGLDPRSLTVPELGHLELAGYDEAARGYSSGDPEMVTAWVRHCVDAISLGARESLAVCEAFVRMGAR